MQVFVVFSNAKSAGSIKHLNVEGIFQHECEAEDFVSENKPSLNSYQWYTIDEHKMRITL